jgi:uncharacterized protein YihD (DUF1040 family)
MAVPQKTKPRKGSIEVASAKWARAFDLVYLSIVQKYADASSEDNELKLPIDTVLQVSAGIALKLVELEDGDDA